MLCNVLLPASATSHPMSTFPEVRLAYAESSVAASASLFREGHLEIALVHGVNRALRPDHQLTQVCVDEGVARCAHRKYGYARANRTPQRSSMMRMALAHAVR